MKDFERRNTSSAVDDQDVESVTLIWLDPNANSSTENLVTQEQLRRIIHRLKTFNVVNECEQYIRLKSSDDRIYLIASGLFGQELIPRISPLRQFCSAYIYCRDKKRNEAWSKQYRKVRGVFVELEPLIKKLQSDYSRCVQSRVDEAFPVHFGKSNPTFLSSQLLFNSLTRMRSLSTDRPHLINLCEAEYHNDPRETTVIKQFKENYSSDQAIWWYTRDCSIRRIFSKALTTQHLDLLFTSGFFLRDIYDTLRKNFAAKSVHVYCGQIMSLAEWHPWENSIGEYFILDRFLEAKVHRQSAISNLYEFPIHDDLMRVLFEIEADPGQNMNQPFANITPLMYSSQEPTILFMVGSSFRLTNIQFDKKTTLWIAKIVLNDVPKDYDPHNLVSCGRWMLERCQRPEQAEKYFSRLLKEIPETHLDAYLCCHALAYIFFNQCQYDRSLQFYQQALHVVNYHQIHPGRTYHFLGCTYQKIGDYSRALHCYEEALEHWKDEARQDDLVLVSDCWNNMGCIYEMRERYSQAFECHHQARRIRADLGLNLGSSFNNIANIYLAAGDYASAVEHYCFALEAKKKLVPHQHLTIATTLANIALVYECDENWSRALDYYNQASMIFSSLYPPVHSYNVDIKECIERVRSMTRFQTFHSSSETTV